MLGWLVACVVLGRLETAWLRHATGLSVSSPPFYPYSFFLGRCCPDGQGTALAGRQVDWCYQEHFALVIEIEFGQWDRWSSGGMQSAGPLLVPFRTCTCVDLIGLNLH